MSRLREFVALRAQHLPVEQHAVLFHAQQHRHERLLALFIEVLSSGTAEICGHSTSCRRSVTSESSAEYSAALSTGTWLKGICLAPLPATSS